MISTPYNELRAYNTKRSTVVNMNSHVTTNVYHDTSITISIYCVSFCQSRITVMAKAATHTHLQIIPLLSEAILTEVYESLEDIVEKCTGQSYRTKRRRDFYLKLVGIDMQKRRVPEIIRNISLSTLHHLLETEPQIIKQSLRCRPIALQLLYIHNQIFY